MKTRLLWLIAGLMAPAALAQSTDDSDGWYRVELIVFANRDPEAALSERWPLLPDLDYPDRWQRLEDGPLEIPVSTDVALTSLADTAPQPPIDLMWDRSMDALWREWREKTLFAQPQVTLEPIVSLTVPNQRVPLPAAQRELDEQRRRIDASAGLEVLFHQAWVQRIRDERESLPLILDGPDRFGDYPELQGSVLIYAGRYLHIATNLWLNTAGYYLDRDPRTAGWRMPRPPLPVTGDSEAMVPFRVELEPGWLPPETPSVGESDADELADPEAARALDARAALPAPEASRPDYLGPDTVAETAEPPSGEADVPRHSAYDYEFRHAVRVQQRRRMRSGELHYIDHPLLGVLVRIDRHEFEPFIEESESSLADTR